MSVDLYHKPDRIKHIGQETMDEVLDFMNYAEERFPDLKGRLEYSREKENGVVIFKNMKFKYFYLPAKYYYNFPYKKLGVPLKRKEEESRVRSSLKGAIRSYFKYKYP